MDNSALRLIANFTTPGSFIATYTYLLRDQKINSRKVMISTTKRMLRLYLEAEQELKRILNQCKMSFFKKIKKSREITLLKKRVSKLRNDICSWVNRTISFFVLNSESIVF